LGLIDFDFANFYSDKMHRDELGIFKSLLEYLETFVKEKGQDYVMERLNFS